MTEDYSGSERRKSDQATHDMLLSHGMKIEHMADRIGALEETLKETVNRLLEDRKECWKTCTSQLRSLDKMVNENSGDIKSIKRVGSVVAFGLTLLGGWIKLGGGGK